MLEKLRAEVPLNDKDKKIHEQGLVTILKQIHDELDDAVLEAYGWGDLAGTALRSGPANESPLNPAEAPADKDSPILVPCAGPPGGRSLPGDALLTRLVALNHQRAAEEKRGLIRWLRPEYQNPAGRGGPAAPISQDLPGTEESASSPSKIQNQQSSIVNPSTQAAWPASLSAQVSAVQKLLPLTGSDPAALAGHFGKRTKARIQQISEILETLTALGKL